MSGVKGHNYRIFTRLLHSHVPKGPLQFSDAKVEHSERGGGREDNKLGLSRVFVKVELPQ